MRGKAPLRISFAGGGTDLSYLFEQHGGVVISSTINKFCHMTLNKRDDDKIVVNGKSPDNILIKNTLEVIKPDYGFDLYYYNDIEPGSGLGNSSSFVALLVTLLSETSGVRYDDREIIEIVYDIESRIGQGGWQDQFATVTGGFNLMEFYKEEKIIYPLRLKYRTICELEENLVLFNIGDRDKESSDIQGEQSRDKDVDRITRLLNLKSVARRIKESLLNNRVENIGEYLNQAWNLKRDDKISNEYIDNIYHIARQNGASGGKLLGAGQGGHMLFFCSPENRQGLVERLQNEGLKYVQFNFWQNGVETW